MMGYHDWDPKLLVCITCVPIDVREQNSNTLLSQQQCMSTVLRKCPPVNVRTIGTLITASGFSDITTLSSLALKSIVLSVAPTIALLDPLVYMTDV